mgnify:FL=1|jgi:hypothetical protein
MQFLKIETDIEIETIDNVIEFFSILCYNNNKLNILFSVG